LPEKEKKLVIIPAPSLHYYHSILQAFFVAARDGEAGLARGAMLEKEAIVQC